LTAGLGTSDQTLPFQLSISVWPVPEAKSPPTETQLVVLVQLTAFKRLEPLSEGLGVTDHGGVVAMGAPATAAFVGRIKTIADTDTSTAEIVAARNLCM